MKNKLGIEFLGGALILSAALLASTATALAQDDGVPGGYNSAPAGQSLDNLVSRIALYPDPLLAQIFGAAVYPDQVAAAAQGQPGPFDPSVEALRQYPSVLQMMASDPGWTQALGQVMAENQGGVMDAIQNLRQEAQQYGYLQSGPQMQVMDNGGYIDIEPVGGYLYVPMYDPYVVFARPRAGFFVGGAIRFGGGFRWAGGYNRFDWGSHQVYMNSRVWSAPVGRGYAQPARQFAQRSYEGNGGWNRSYAAPSARPQERQNFAPAQRNFAPQRNFTPQRPTEQRNFTAPRQMQQQRSFTPQTRSQGGSQRGNEGRGRR